MNNGKFTSPPGPTKCRICGTDVDTYMCENCRLKQERLAIDTFFKDPCDEKPEVEMDPNL